MLVETPFGQTGRAGDILAGQPQLSWFTVRNSHDPWQIVVVLSAVVVVAPIQEKRNDILKEDNTEMNIKLSN